MTTFIYLLLFNIPYVLLLTNKTKNTLRKTLLSGNKIILRKNKQLLEWYKIVVIFTLLFAYLRLNKVPRMQNE